MKRHFPTALLLILLADLSAARPVAGQPPDPGRYSEEQFEVKSTRGHKAVMRDGVRLSVDMFQPKAGGRFPAILIITPYNSNPGFQARGSWFAKRGYVVAEQKLMHTAGQSSHLVLPAIPRR